MSTTTEWAMQYRTFIDGPFERTIVRPYEGRPLFTESEARKEVDMMNRSRNHNVARLVSRTVTDREAAK